MKQPAMPNDFPGPAALAKATSAAVDAATSVTPLEWWLAVKISIGLVVGSILAGFRSWRDAPARPWPHVWWDIGFCLPMMIAGWFTSIGLGYDSGVGVGICAIIGFLGPNGLRRLIGRWVGGK